MPAAEALVAAAGVGVGDRVLDVAAGTGNVAVAAARRGAEVVAIDLTPAQVQAGQARTADEGLSVEWLVGDAEALPVEDDSFDHVLSAFGVMYAPRPHVAAAELLRVARPDGVVGIASWPPNGFNDRIGQAVEEIVGGGGDPGPQPSDWGDPETVARILSGAGRPVRSERDTVVMHATSAEAVWEEASANVGFVIMARSGLAPEDFAAFGRAYVALAEECSEPTANGIRLEIAYLRTLA